MGKPINDQEGLEDNKYDGRKRGRLGSKNIPAAVSVQTEKRRDEIAAKFEKNGWHYTIEVDPDKSEDIGDLNRLLNPPQPVVADKKVGPNEPCPCGSGKKHKKCCGA